MRIAVCDDSASTLDQLRDYLARFSAELGDKFEVFYFNSGEALMAHYPSSLDILLLDIRLYELSGMDIARHIRTFDEELCIIFISNMTQYALESYEVHAFHFIVKPFSYEVFRRELLLAVRRLSSRKQICLTVKNDSGVFRLPVQDILYIETLDHKLMIHTRNRAVICYTSMNQLEKQLVGESFFRCHQSFIVNLSQIAALGRDDLSLTSGDRIPVSRHRRKELIQAMTKYAGEVL